MNFKDFVTESQPLLAVTLPLTTTTTMDARTVLASIVVKGKYFLIENDISGH